MALFWRSAHLTHVFTEVVGMQMYHFFGSMLCSTDVAQVRGVMAAMLVSLRVLFKNGITLVPPVPCSCLIVDASPSDFPPCFSVEHAVARFFPFRVTMYGAGGLREGVTM
jgi:hypothetical protein